MKASSSFGEILFRRRKELGLTQSELAGRIGVQPNYIVYLEKGERKPSDRTVLKLADALGLARGDMYLAANPQIREFLKISDENEVLVDEMPEGLRALAEDELLRSRLAVTDEEIATVARMRLPGRATAPAQYIHLILSLRFGFA